MPVGERMGGAPGGRRLRQGSMSALQTVRIHSYDGDIPGRRGAIGACRSDH